MVECWVKYEVRNLGKVVSNWEGNFGLGWNVLDGFLREKS